MTHQASRVPARRAPHCVSATRARVQKLPDDGKPCNAAEERRLLPIRRNPARNPETAMAQQPPLNPGDEAEPGVPGTGEDLCPDCNGTGKRDGADCETCGGTGKVTQGIGGG
jgi:hypothetical protein